jgi:hypothetical protein
VAQLACAARLLLVPLTSGSRWSSLTSGRTRAAPGRTRCRPRRACRNPCASSRGPANQGRSPSPIKPPPPPTLSLSPKTLAAPRRCQTPNPRPPPPSILSVAASPSTWSSSGGSRGGEEATRVACGRSVPCAARRSSPESCPPPLSASSDFTLPLSPFSPCGLLV